MSELVYSSEKNSWYATMKQSILKYYPYLGGCCPSCGRICKTQKTDSENGIRDHFCPTCKKWFKTVSKAGFKARSTNDQKEKYPTSLDTKKEIPVQVDSNKPKKSSNSKRDRKKKGRN